jgi:hypothetical protein
MNVESIINRSLVLQITKDKEYKNCDINDQLINQLIDYTECLNCW